MIRASMALQNTSGRILGVKTLLQSQQNEVGLKNENNTSFGGMLIGEL